MANKKKTLYPSEVYYKELGKRKGKQIIYQEYLDYRLGLPLGTEHILNEAIRIFKASTPEKPDRLDVNWKLFGSLLLAAYNFPICDENSVIDKLRRSGITSSQLCYDFDLKIPTSKLKLISCAPTYVDYFKEPFEKMESRIFPIDETPFSRLSPEKLFYQLMRIIERPQTNLEIEDYGNMDEELFDTILAELQRRDTVLEQMDKDLKPVFMWTSQSLGYTEAESIISANEIFTKSQEDFEKPDIQTPFTCYSGQTPKCLKKGTL